MSDNPRIEIERDGHVLILRFARPEKYNAFDVRMLRELADAYTLYDDDDELWCAVVLAQGKHFTAGLDLAEVGPAVASGAPLFPAGSVNPLGFGDRVRTKPVIMAAHGICFTIGIELMLASDIRLCAEGTRFGQIEIKRGIFPFGGATVRLPQVAGWGNAMRWLLTGGEFDAAEAHRIGLVQEVEPTPEALADRAIALAHEVAAQAPLGVQATLRNARVAVEQDHHTAIAALQEEAQALFGTADAQEGLQSFLERRDAKFSGK